MGSSPAPAQPLDDGGDDDHATEVERLVGWLDEKTAIALTGAGCSTESGIPDYRGPGRSGPPRQPILHDAYLRRADVRQRYWARATTGWARFAGATPNPAHHALASLEISGHLLGVITQNVDRLHQRAGSRRVVELHGALEDVRCLGCSALHPRADVHDWMVGSNPDWLERRRAIGAQAPDGDAALDAADVADFQVVPCPACGGVLKPEVVFFGGTVPEPTVAEAWSLLDAAEVLLVIGSSLEVYSGYRFVRGAAARGVPW